VALPKSTNRIFRRSVVGMEGMWAKMWDPPRESLLTPDALDVAGIAGGLPLGTRPNPVPAFMQAQGLGTMTVPNTVQRTLLNGVSLQTWDRAKNIEFMTFNDPDFFPGPAWPGPTIRIPRGVIFHCDTQGKGPPPHTIHWHGQEPTPMNDGVGHCSMEIGTYTYQFQPNFIGTYFYHCHRNTVQHFEFGLYGMLLIEPPDAYDGLNAGGYPRRTAANLRNFPQFAEAFVDGDSTYGVAGANDIGVGHPHAFTVRYDQECLWVFDDRDSVWSDLTMGAGSVEGAKAFYPGGSNTNDGPPRRVIPQPVPPVPAPTQPGVDDQFANGFFHDFNADYWYVTGVPIPAARGGSAVINPAGAAPAGGGLPGGLIPPALNSGVSGMRVDVDANAGDVVLVRVLDGAYNSVEVSFPLDVTIIAFDGRALGVPPFARYNHAFVLPANTPFRLSTARRFDALIRSNTPFTGEATVKFYDTRGLNVRPLDQQLLVTGRIPIRFR
jgi:Multicopper oxidase